MEIVSIFAGHLYAFEPEDGLNEYDLCMERWTDAEYLRDFAKRNGINPSVFVPSILKEAREVLGILQSIGTGKGDITAFFRPLHNTEYKSVILSLQKGKLKDSYLRLYAVKVEEGVFVITGGAIKIVHLMEDQPETSRELGKIKYAQHYLRANGISDAESFYEFLTEPNNE